MIKLQNRKDDVPHDNETDKKCKIPHFNPHGKEIFKGSQIESVIDDRSGQGKGEDHDQEVKQF